jgi:hypothetical protein
VGLTKELKKQAMALSQMAMEKLFADEDRAQKIAAAIGSVQKGKQALDRGQDQLMHAFSFATRSDYKTVGKQLSSLKRRVRELDEKLGELVKS